MDNSEAQFLFAEADRLFREEQYLEALQYLSQLDSAFPDTFNILYPMVLCCEKLGRTAEAYERCAHLLEHFPEERHQAKVQAVFGLICRQQALERTAENTTTAGQGHEIIKDPPVHVPIEMPGTIMIGGFLVPWRNILIGVVILAAFLALITFLPLYIQQSTFEQDTGQVADTVITAYGDASAPAKQDPAQVIVFLLLVMLARFSFTCIVTYVVLWSMNKLPHEDLLRDSIDVAIAMAIFNLINMFFPYIGFFVAVYFIARHYEMSFSEAIIFLLLQLVLHLFFLYMVFPLVFGENALTVIQMLR